MLNPYTPGDDYPQDYRHFWTLSIWGNIYYYTCLSFNDDICNPPSGKLYSVKYYHLEHSIWKYLKSNLLRCNSDTSYPSFQEGKYSIFPKIELKMTRTLSLQNVTDAENTFY